MLPLVVKSGEQQGCTGAYHLQSMIYLISLWTCSSASEWGQRGRTPDLADDVYNCSCLPIIVLKPAQEAVMKLCH